MSKSLRSITAFNKDYDRNILIVKWNASVLDIDIKYEDWEYAKCKIDWRRSKNLPDIPEMIQVYLQLKNDLDEAIKYHESLEKEREELKKNFSLH